MGSGSGGVVYQGWSVILECGDEGGARVVASVVYRRVVNSVARLGGRSAMMCGRGRFFMLRSI